MKQITKEYISLWQLFILIMNFELGSAVVIGIGVGAKQDAWLAVFLASIFGAALMYVYCKMVEFSKGKNLYGMLGQAFGKWIDRTISAFYTIYFFYIAARVIRDFAELISSAILPYTPIEVDVFCLTFLVAYIVYKGIEVMG